MRYPIEIDFQKSPEENHSQLMWLKKIDRLILDNHRDSNYLQCFGTHFNITMQGYENLPQDEIYKRLKKVGVGSPSLPPSST